MAVVTVDVLRAVKDPAYAATLTSDQWRALVDDPAWGEMVAEMPEIVAPFLARFADKLPGYAGSTPAQRPTEQAATQFAILGKRVPRVQGLGVVTGIGKYVENITVPGMLYMRTLRSPHPHARVKKVDISNAEKVPGVKAILHRGNLPKEYQDVRIGSGPPFRFLFNEEVYEVGAPVAVVAAESVHAADEAIRQIQVEYEVLPATLDMLEGMKASTPKQWDNNRDGTIVNIERPLVRGEGDAALSQADVVVEATAERSTEQHLALELTTSISWWDNDRLIMYYTVQYAHGARAGLAQALKLPQNKVRVIQTGYLGSGYGYRTGVELPEIHAAILAKITNRPVRVMYTRAEDFVTRIHRPRMRHEMKMGVKRDGTIVAAHIKAIADVGAWRATAGAGSWYGFQMLYNIPNLKLEAVDVFTNKYKTGPMRCVSHPAGTFALETLMDKVAYRIGMNPLEFRLKNLNEVGNPDNKKPFSNPGIRECLTKAAEAIGWQQKWHAPKTREVSPGVFHGIGLAAHACSHGAGSAPANGSVVINTDGTLQVISGATDIGPGERTTMAMIAAETVGIPYEQTTISPEVDTDFTSDTGVTAGSRQTNSGGWGVYQAAMDARRQLLEWGAKKFEADAKNRNETLKVSPEDLDVRNGEVVLKSDPSKKLRVAEVVQFTTSPIIGRGVHQQDPTWERTAWAAHAAEVEVDTVTGSVKVLKYVAAHDVGRALNPLALEQQIEGGVVMGLGAALTEQLLVDQSTGLPLNDNILDYKALSIKDVPEKIDVILVERPKEYGVYGVHGIGEPPIAPPAAVIANAVYNAIGVWIDTQPITREKVLAALKRA